MMIEERLPLYVRSYRNSLRPLCEGSTTKGFGCTRHATMGIRNGGAKEGFFCLTHFEDARNHVLGFARLPLNGGSE